ncbi:MAG: bifunctional folylpolyglutamate synthase/dihydrofolate synthase [Candidatus Omnitrophica bacterium]|nr:bifunctional folylpolyglutamate synthase/dihydrofolate synthase [Candidatus Omnitrophota bacterium]
MTYREAVEYLDSFINYERMTDWEYPEAFKLDRMRSLVKELGNPQNAYESAIIAGSKGKGSTAAILSSILRMENWRVGLYTSPHLVDIRERIQVNGLPINEIRFAEHVLHLKEILDVPSWKKNPPTYFEILTAMAFAYFKEMKAQAVVLEVGLGGLFDSTNIAPSRVVGLTPISLEHTDKLGRTPAKIAVQKCGVIKGRELVVSGAQEPEVDDVIRRAAAEKDAELIRVGREIRIFEREFGENFQRFDARTPFGNYFNLEIGLLGVHQIENAACAIGLAKAFEKKCRMKVSDSAVRQGVLDARWPGRLEKIEDCPRVILDGAQNPASAKRLAAALKRHFSYERLVLVLGVSADKDLEGILTELLPECSCVIAAQAENPRALPARELAEAVRHRDSSREVMVCERAPEALEKAKSLACPGDLILVTGSLFLVGDVKKHAEAV